MTVKLLQIETLHEDKDFRTKMSREVLEELCKDLYPRYNLNYRMRKEIMYLWGVVIDTWILGSQKFAKYPKKKYPIVSKSIQKYQFLFLFLSINLIH